MILNTLQQADTQTPKRGFAVQEFATRCAKAQQIMQQKNIAALLLTTEAEIRYFTGFMTQFWQSPTRPWYVILPCDAKPIAIIPTIGVELMQQCYISEIDSWSSPHISDDGISLLQQKLQAFNGKIGMMMGRETHIRMPYNDLLKLQAGRIEWVDITADIQSIRMIKSAAEIAKVTYICQIITAVFDELPCWVESGMQLDELFRQFKIRALDKGADDVSYLVGAAGHGGYTNVIAPPSSRPLVEGDVLMLDTGSIWDGYFCDFDRNFAIGTATDEVIQTHEVLYNAITQALALAKPGVTMSQLYQSMFEVLHPKTSTATNSAGGGNIGRYGHGLGIQLTETPSIIAWDNTELKQNMIITLEPCMSYANNLMMVAEENIVITEHGARLLTKRPPAQLPIIKVK